MGWINTLAKKFPKLTQKRITTIIVILVIGAIITFRSCSFNYDKKTGNWSCDSQSNVKIEKGKDDAR